MTLSSLAILTCTNLTTIPEKVNLMMPRIRCYSPRPPPRLVLTVTPGPLYSLFVVPVAFFDDWSMQNSHAININLKGQTVPIHTNTYFTGLLISMLFTLSNMSSALYNQYCVGAPVKPNKRNAPRTGKHHVHQMNLHQSV